MSGVFFFAQPARLATAGWLGSGQKRQKKELKSGICGAKSRLAWRLRQRVLFANELNE
jgi:hypothetical protein